MIINLTGNIASGKSSTVRELKKYIPKLVHVSIDDCRLTSLRLKTEDDTPLITEQRAWKIFLKAIRKAYKRNQPIVMESSGVGWRLSWLYEDKLAKDMFIVRLDCSKEECYRRSQEREKDLSKIPWFFDTTTRETIQIIEEKLNSARGPVANLILSSEDLTPDEIALEIILNIGISGKKCSWTCLGSLKTP